MEPPEWPAPRRHHEPSGSRMLYMRTASAIANLSHRVHLLAGDVVHEREIFQVDRKGLRRPLIPQEPALPEDRAELLSHPRGLRPFSQRPCLKRGPLGRVG